MESFSICPSTRKLKIRRGAGVSFLRQETAQRYIFLTSHFKTSPEFERFTIECRETKTEKKKKEKEKEIKRITNSGQSQKPQALQ